MKLLEYFDESVVLTDAHIAWLKDRKKSTALQTALHDGHWVKEVLK